MNDAILPLDLFVVTSDSYLTGQDRNSLIKLYQPVVGITSINLYFTLWSYLSDNISIGDEENHHTLMSKMKIDMDEIIKSRKMLEAVGLLKTYVDNGKIKTYIYKLYAPLSPYEFINHPILSVILYSTLGKKDYLKTIDSFKIPEINYKNFTDITSSFNDVFEVVPSTNYDVMIENLKNHDNGNIKINNNKIDFNIIASVLPNFVLPSLNNETKDLINKLSYIYSIDTSDMCNIIVQSINEKNVIDKKTLRKLCSNHYRLDNSGVLPSAIYKEQNNEYKSKSLGNSKRDKMIYTFETTTPYDFLSSKYQGSITNRDKKLLEYLLVDIGLNSGVVNVLIDYVLRINNQKLSKPYIDAIAGQWSRLGIKTVEEAMDQASKEHKNVKPKKQTSTSKVPEWFDKKIEKDTSSKEEIEEMKELLKEYR